MSTDHYAALTHPDGASGSPKKRHLFPLGVGRPSTPATQTGEEVRVLVRVGSVAERRAETASLSMITTSRQRVVGFHPAACIEGSSETARIRTRVPGSDLKSCHSSVKDQTAGRKRAAGCSLSSITAAEQR